MDCELTTDLGSRGYFRRLSERAWSERVPITGIFDLTYRCNFGCVHCYAGPETPGDASALSELKMDQVVSLLEQACEAGCLFALFSGGEPLLRRDFAQIYARARQLGLIVTVFSNASLVVQDHLDVFSEYPPHLFEVSFYGATASAYESVTRVPGSYERAREGIERLLERGVRVGLKTMILRENLEEIRDIALLAETLGVGFRLDPLVHPRLDGDPTPTRHRVEPRLAVEAELASEKRRRDMRRIAELMAKPTTVRPGEDNRLYRCGAGVSSFHIDPRGTMRPCLVSRELAYETTGVGFTNAWKAVNAAVDRTTWDGVGGCAGCEDAALCGYCPGVFALEQASPSIPPKYMCMLGKNRRRVLSALEAEVECVGAS